MSKIRGGETYLSQHLTHNDYYSENAKVIGRWSGDLCVDFGLTHNATVSPDDFDSLRKGINPCTGKQFVQRVHGQRTTFYDFQISAPKSVSVIGCLFDDEGVVKKAHTDAAGAAFRFLEHQACRRVSRTSESGPSYERTSKLIAARFDHDTSRDIDPQIHTHYVVSNVARSADDEFYALTEAQILKSIKAASKLYQAELSRRLVNLGYRVDASRNKAGSIEQIQIQGVSEETCRKFSKRRQQVESGIDMFRRFSGRDPSVKEKHDIAAGSRKDLTKYYERLKKSPLTNSEIDVIGKFVRVAKMHKIEPEEVRKKQLQQINFREFAELSSCRVRNRRTPPALTFKEFAIIVEAATKSLEERNIAFRHSDLVAEVTDRCMGRASMEDILGAINSSECIEPWSEFYVTSVRNKKILDYLIDRAANPTAFEGLALSARHDVLLDRLDSTQRSALELLLSHPSDLAYVRGPAGAGKSYLLQTFDKIVRHEGREVVYAAPTHAAAGEERGLASDGLPAETVAAMLYQVERDGATSVLPENGYLVVDEAGMVSAKDMAALSRACKEAKCVLRLVGDERQHSSVAAGGAIETLRKNGMATFEMSQIHRQKGNADYLKVAEALSQGRTDKGLQLLDEINAIAESPEYIEEAAEAYALAVASNDNVMAVLPTHAEIEKFTQTAREHLTEMGILDTTQSIESRTFRSFGRTEAEREEAFRYQEGDVILLEAISSDASKSSVKPGLYRVLSSGSENSVTIQPLDNGSAKPRCLTINPKSLADQGLRVDIGKISPITICKGDKIVLTGSYRDGAKGARYKNGQEFTALGLDKKGRMMFRDRYGKTRILPQRLIKSGRVSYAHAMTSHRSQGATVDRVIVAGNRMDERAIYVSATRARKDIKLFTPDKTRLLRKLSQTDHAPNRSMSIG